MASGVWRTVKGRRVFIEDGQSLYDAMEKSGKFSNLKKKIDESNIDSQDDKTQAEFNEHARNIISATYNFSGDDWNKKGGIGDSLREYHYKQDIERNNNKLERVKNKYGETSDKYLKKKVEIERMNKDLAVDRYLQGRGTTEELAKEHFSNNVKEAIKYTNKKYLKDLSKAREDARKNEILRQNTIVHSKTNAIMRYKQGEIRKKTLLNEYFHGKQTELDEFVNKHLK